MPVIAPKKAKIETVTSEQNISIKESNVKDQKGVSEKEEMLSGQLGAQKGKPKHDNDEGKIDLQVYSGESDENNNDVKKGENVNKDRHTEVPVELCFEVKKGKVVSREISVHDDGERVYSIFNTAKVGDIKEDTEIHFGDILPKGAVFKAENISCKMSFLPDGGKVRLGMKYELE